MSLIPFTGQQPINQALIVSPPVFVIAGLTVIASFVSYLWVPKKAILPASLVVYFLLTATVASLITTTGGASSPFLALWMLVAIAAGIFGVWGLVPILAIMGVFVAAEYLKGHLSIDLLIMVGFGGLLPLITSFIIWHNKSGEPSGSNRAYEDLANELSQVATQSEVVINAIGDGVVAIDNKGIIQLINPAAQRIIGWGKQDALALSYKSVLPLTNQKGEPLDVSLDPIQQVLNTNQQVRNNDLVIITHSEKKFMASLVISPVGEIGSGAIIVFRDISKEKSEERGQAEFISTASHEMRTPVASIEGYLGLALNPATAQIDAKARDFIMKAHESAQHLGHLFQDLLDVSKAEDGRLSNNPKVIDVMAFTYDVILGLQQKAADKGLHLTFKPRPNDDGRHLSPVYNVNLDNDHIREIINNLTENAIKYTLQGEIVIDVVGNDDTVVISVKDSGIGIPTEDMSHLFQKFYRVDNEATRQIGGTGLGLYLCRRLAESMGGRIWAESEYKKGSTFYLEMPRLSNQEADRLKEQQALASKAAAEKAAQQPVEVVTFAPPNESSAIPINIVQAATTVPRGQSLTMQQIADHVAQLKEMARAQALAEQPPNNAQPVAPRPPGIPIPVRDYNPPQQ